jgi:ABC-type uncharacterized transport system substrate-binding protein
LPRLSRHDLSQHRPDVIVVASSLGAGAARDVLHTIPGVFVGVSDPVALGVVKRLARPSGTSPRRARSVLPSPSRRCCVATK